MSAVVPQGFVHRRRRGAELLLLVLALAVGVGAYAVVGLGVKEELPADLLGYAGWLTALAVGANVVVRFTAPNVVNTFNGTLNITAANNVPATTSVSLTATTR